MNTRLGKENSPMSGGVVGLALLLAVGLALPSLARAGGEEDVEVIGVDEVRRLQQSPRRIVLVDVRSPQEFRESRIAGAVNVPLTELERRFAEIPRQGLVVLY